MKRKNRLVITFLMMGIIWGIGTQLSNNLVSADHLDSIGSTLYQYERYVEEERYDNAKSLLSTHRDDIIELFETKEKVLANDLIDLLDTNIAVVNDNSFNHWFKSKQAQSLVLAVDSINNPNDPIWLRWKKDLEQSLSTYLSSQSATPAQMQQLVTQWEIMSPALKISLEEDQYNKIASSYKQINVNGNFEGNTEQLETVFRQTQMLDINNSSDSRAAINFIWMISVVGGFITVTLSYVAWKKYKGEKINQKRMIN